MLALLHLLVFLVSVVGGQGGQLAPPVFLNLMSDGFSFALVFLAEI